MLNSFNSFPNYQNEDFKTFENEDLKISNNISSSIRQNFIRKVYGILSNNNTFFINNNEINFSSKNYVKSYWNIIFNDINYNNFTFYNNML